MQGARSAAPERYHFSSIGDVANTAQQGRWSPQWFFDKLLTALHANRLQQRREKLFENHLLPVCEQIKVSLVIQ